MVLPLELVWPAGQLTHTDAEVAPTTEDALPAGQGTHTLLDSYVPALHAMHWDELVAPSVKVDVPLGHAVQEGADEEVE